MFFLLVCKKVKVLPMFPGGPSEMIEDVQKVSCPSELTEGQNQTIQVWDLNYRISKYFRNIFDPRQRNLEWFVSMQNS